jgi:hypothetical protein
MPKAKATHSVQEFSVIGRGRFPIDMLRYDNCVPASENDAISIETGKDMRTVRLRRFVTDNTNGPAVGRWQSFGWDIKR